MVTIFRQIYVTSRSGQLSLATAPWVGTMSTSDGFRQCEEGNSKFSETVDPVTSTTGILVFDGVLA